MSQLTDNITRVIKELNKNNPHKNMDDLAKYIGFSQGGLYTSFVKERMKIATLEKICDFYEVSIVDVIKRALNYTKEGSNAIREPLMSYGSGNEYLELLKEKLKFKEQQVDFYKEELRKYKNNKKPHLKRQGRCPEILFRSGYVLFFSNTCFSSPNRFIHSITSFVFQSSLSSYR